MMTRGSAANSDSVALYDVANTLKGIVRGSAVLFIGATLTIILNPLVRVVISRGLGPGGYGFVALGLSLLFISASFAVLGFDSGLARFVSYYHAKGDFGRIKGLLLSVGGVVFISSLLIGGTLFAFAETAAVVFFHRPDFFPVLRIFSLSLPFLSLTQLFVGALRGFRQMKLMVVINSVCADGLRILLLLFLLARGMSVIEACGVYLISYVATFFVSLYLLTQTISKTYDWRSISADYSLKEFLAFSAPLLTSQGLGQLRRQMDLLILSYFVSVHDVGIYAAALLVPRIVLTGTNAFNVAAMPYISHLFAEARTASLQRVHETLIRWAFYCTFPVLLVTVIMPGEIIRLVFGAEYQGGAMALTILMIGVVLAAVPAGLQDETLIAAGETRMKLLASVVALICGTLSAIIFIPRFGIIGAAVANVSAILALFAAEFIYLYKRFHFQPFGRGHVKFLISAGFGGVLLIGLNSVPMTWWYKVIIAFPLLYGTGILGLHLLKGFDEVELGLLRTVGERSRRLFRRIG